MLLIIESSAEFPSVALVDEAGNLLMERYHEQSKSHAEVLPVMIEEAWHHTLSLGKLVQAVAINEGPGSYTGLRIGLSLAKGLCYGASIPLIAVGGLTGMLQYAQIKFPEKLAIFAMLDARRDEVYVQYWHSKQGYSEIQAQILAPGLWNIDPKDTLFIGNANEKACRLLGVTATEQITGPTAMQLMPLAVDKWKRQEFVSTAYFEPFYLKEFEAGISKKFAL